MDGISICVLGKSIMSKAKNNITGDSLVSKANSKKYSDNYDRIFRKKIEWEDELVQEAHDDKLKRKDNKDGS
jgi:hypothetical protein